MAQDPFDTLPLARPAVTPVVAPTSPTKEPGDPWDALPVARPAVTAGAPPPSAPTSSYLQAKSSQYGIPLGPPPPAPISKTATPARTPLGAPGADTSVYQDQAAKKTAGEDLTGNAIRFGLEVAAPLAATAFVGPGGGLATRAAVAGLGMAGGTATAELVNEARGQAPPKPLEFIQQLGISGLAGAGGEIAATGLAAAWRGAKNVVAKYGPSKLTAPMAGRVTQAGRDAELLLGDDVTPGQMTDSKGLQILDTIASGGLFSKQYTQVRQRATAKLLDRMKTLLSPYGQTATRDEAGRVTAAKLTEQAGLRDRLAVEASGLATDARTAAQATVGNARPAAESGAAFDEARKLAYQEAKDATKPLYAEIDKSGVRVPLQPTRDFIEQDIARTGQQAAVLQGGSLSTVRRAAMALTPEEQAAAAAAEDAAASAAGTSVAEQNVRNQATGGAGSRLAELKDDPRYAEVNAILTDVARETGAPVEAEMTFEQAHRFRSALGQRIRAAKRSPNAADKTNLGFLEQTFAVVDQSMTDAAAAAEKAGIPNIKNTLNKANAMWKDMVNTFDNSVLGEIADKHPRLIGDAMTRPGMAADMRLARKAVGEQAWNGIAATKLDDLLTGPNGWVDGHELNKRLADYSVADLKALFGESGYGHISEYLKRTRSQEGLSEAAAALRKQAPVYKKIATALEPTTDLDEIVKLKLLTGGDFKTVQSAHMDDLFTGKSGQTVTGKDLMGRLHEYGAERLGAIYGNPTADKLFQLARVMDAVEQTGSGLFKYALPSAQLMSVLGAGAATVTGNLSPNNFARVTALLLAPSVLAKVMLNTTTRQWLTTGLKAQVAKDPAGMTRALSQLIGWMVKEGILPGQGKGGGPAGTSAFERVAPLPRTTGRGGGPGPLGGGPPQPLPR